MSKATVLDDDAGMIGKPPERTQPMKHSAKPTLKFARLEGMRCAGDGTSPVIAKWAAFATYQDDALRAAFLFGYHVERRRLERSA
jgi:hypothetical protein